MATILGITGGIGSGKSSVSRLLSSYCLAPLIDLDQCCRHLLDRGQAGWQVLHEAFGATYELANGSIDRRKLREEIFRDAGIRRRVDSLLHPLALSLMHEQINAVQHETHLVLVEIPLLYEAAWHMQVDTVLVVYARRAVQCCRLMRRDGVDRRQARRALSTQLDLGKKARMADYVIDNSRNWLETRRAVVALGDTLCSEQEMINIKKQEKVLDSAS